MSGIDYYHFYRIQTSLSEIKSTSFVKVESCGISYHFQARGWTVLFFLQHRVWNSLLDAYIYKRGGTCTMYMNSS